MVKLLELGPGTIDWVATVVEHWAPSHRWSLRGQSPTPRLLQKLLGDGVLDQRLVVADGGRRLALVQLVDHEVESGLARVAVLADPTGDSDVPAAIGVFLADAFRGLALHKAAVAACADELDVERCLGPLATYVGRLAEHERRGPDSYVDLCLYDIWPRTVFALEEHSQ